MKMSTGILVAAVFAATIAAAPAATISAPVNAASSTDDRTCLQNNRLWGWQVLNSRTVSVNDRTNKRFTIHLAGGCVGLNNAVQALAITGDLSLGCVRRGNFVRYRAPALGRMSCAITGVELVPPKSPNAPERAQAN